MSELDDLGDAIQDQQGQWVPDGYDLRIVPAATVEVDLQALSDQFDTACAEKHALGVEKYGEGTWLKADTIAMAMDEMVDMANYIRFSWIKLAMIRAQMEAAEEMAQPLPGKEMLGKESFYGPAGG